MSTRKPPTEAEIDNPLRFQNPLADSAKVIGSRDVAGVVYEVSLIGAFDGQSVQVVGGSREGGLSVQDGSTRELLGEILEELRQQRLMLAEGFNLSPENRK